MDKILLLELAVGFTAALPRDSDRPTDRCSYWPVRHLCPLSRVLPLCQKLLPRICGCRRECVSLCIVTPFACSTINLELQVHVILLAMRQGDYLGHKVEEGSTNIFGWQDLQTTSVKLPQETRKFAISCVSYFYF